MMTPEQIAEIRAREKAAIEGPWWPEPKYDGRERGCAVIAARVDCGPLPGNPTRGMVAIATASINTGARQCEANAAFIAYARTDIPALLDDRDELVARIARLQAVAVAAQWVNPPDHGVTLEELSLYSDEQRRALAALQPGDLP